MPWIAEDYIIIVILYSVFRRGSLIYSAFGLVTGCATVGFLNDLGGIG